MLKRTIFDVRTGEAMSKEIKSVNNFLFAANIIAGVVALLMVGGLAASAVESPDPSVLQGVGGDGGLQFLAKPLALLAISCPVIAAIVRFAASAKSSAKIQPILLMGACCCPLVVIRISF